MGGAEGTGGAGQGGPARRLRAGGLRAGVAAGLAWAAAALPAGAMDWTLVEQDGMRAGSRIVHILGQGGIGGDDAVRLAALVAAHRQGAAAAGLDPDPPVYLDSPGGDPVVGVEIAATIRALGLETFVPEGALCGSACTLAFLGGVERRVWGDFVIHATAIRPGASLAGADGREDPHARTDAVQTMVQFALLASRELIGDTAMVETSLLVPHSDAAAVDDGLLRDWKVITHAMRPAQQVVTPDGPLAGCGRTDWLMGAVARRTMCDNIEAVRRHGEIRAMAAALAARGVEGTAAEQERFEAAWDRCGAREDMADPAFFRRLDACIAATVGARHAELSALTAYFDVIGAEPALSGWKGGGSP